MNPPTESELKRSQKYRFSGTELNRISLKKERKNLPASRAHSHRALRAQV